MWLPRPSVQSAAARVAKTFGYIGSVARLYKQSQECDRLTIVNRRHKHAENSSHLSALLKCLRAEAEYIKR